jgi:hypothetical protein
MEGGVAEVGIEIFNGIVSISLRDIVISECVV